MNNILVAILVVLFIIVLYKWVFCAGYGQRGMDYAYNYYESKMQKPEIDPIGPAPLVDAGAGGAGGVEPFTHAGPGVGHPSDITGDDIYPGDSSYGQFVQDIGVEANIKNSHANYIEDLECITNKSGGIEGKLNNMDSDFGSSGLNVSFVGMRYPQGVAVNNPEKIIDIDKSLYNKPGSYTFRI